MQQLIAKKATKHSVVLFLYNKRSSRQSLLLTTNTF